MNRFAPGDGPHLALRVLLSLGERIEVRAFGDGLLMTRICEISSNAPSHPASVSAPVFTLEHIGLARYVQQRNYLPRFSRAMDADAPADSKQQATGVRSKLLPGLPFVRLYVDYGLVAWRPEGVLDDRLLDQATEWLVDIEREAPSFKRFMDFSRLTEIAVRSSHIFEIARKRAEDYRANEPVRAALFCDEWIGFGIARFYESLMERTLIQAKAFRDRAEAAKWLEVPLAVIELKDEPEP